MSQHHPRFNVFGRLVEIQRAGAQWQAYHLGADGKRRPASFVVPDFLQEHEIEGYLFDLFHESASPHNGDVVRTR